MRSSRCTKTEFGMPIIPTLLIGKKLTDMKGRAAQAKQVAQQFSDFVGGAKATLDVAIYHFRLSGEEGQIVLEALKNAAANGIRVRIAYFKERPRKQEESITEYGGDIGGRFDESPFTGTKVQLKGIEGLDLIHLPIGVVPEPIEGGGHLMHSKYMIRD